MLGALSTDVLNTTVQHIKDVTSSNKFHNFIHEPVDLYKLDISFIHHMEEQMVIIILHAPFAEAKNLLLLYKIASLPVHFNFLPKFSLVLEVGKLDLITIGNTRPFQTLSSSDLANCRCLDATFFWEGGTVLKPNIVHNCLGSLFLASATLIKANCKFRIVDTRGKIFSLGNNTWLVYSVGTIATNHVCPKTRSSSPLTISWGQEVTVKPGCHIPTMDHIIMADKSEELEVHSTWLDWTITLLQLFDHNDAEQIKQFCIDVTFEMRTSE